MEKRAMFWVSLLIVPVLSFLPLQVQAAMPQQMSLVIEAPEDTTIYVTMRGCQAMILLDTAEVINPGCGGLTFRTITPFDILQTNGGKAFFFPGIHEVIYEATDVCGAVDRDTMLVTVLDSIAPIAVCVGPRNVSLDGNGMAILPAHVFDGGSIDSCDLYFKVKRVVPPTGFDCTTGDNPNYMLDDEVKFCCGDMGDSIMVQLRVYDQDPGSGVVPDDTLIGRFADCMALVFVLDKAPPEITCPPDFSIECGEHIDFDTLDLPAYTDNCDSISFEIEIETDIDQCGTGQIRRIIIGTDAGGQSDTCVQTIFVINSTPFNANDTNDLVWPEPYVTVYDCIAVPDTSVSGGPKVRDDECSMVSVSWTDEVYKFSRDACSKVIRTFKVLDWCQYDPRRSSACTPANGCWTFEQIIKVIDTIPPVITHPADTIVPYLQPGCGEMYVELDSATTDICFPGEEVELKYHIDFYQDGSINGGGDDGNASGLYPIGKHYVIYEAKDECANTTFDTLELEVKDRVLPTPIAKSGLIAVVNNMGGGMIMTTVTASMLNASSYDNCTNDEDLIYSFSPQVEDSVRIYDCDSVGVRTVRFWVTDECGNQDYAEIFILIEDTGNHCPNTIVTSSISGLIARHDGSELSDIEVGLYGTGVSGMSMTDNVGRYMHDDLVKDQSYTVLPSKTSDPLEGISTRDIVLIQRHLLGDAPFTETYQMLGADVNGSGHVSTSDIAEIRKLILGVTNELSIGKQWHFMPRSWKFQNALDPWSNPWPQDYTVNRLSDPMEVNFKAFKVGDVDMSYTNLDQNSTRAERTAELVMSYDEAEGVLSIRSQAEIWITGLQFSAELLNGNLENVTIHSDLEGWSDGNYKIDAEQGVVRVSWFSREPVWVPTDLDIVRFWTSSSERSVSLKLTKDIHAELYDEDIQTFQVVLGNNSRAENWINLSVQPNPFTDYTNLVIYSTEEEVLELTITNILGSVVHRQKVNTHAGWNDVELNSGILPQSGVYIIEASNGKRRSEVRVLKSQ